MFDLDGVLLNSKRNMELSWGAVCERHDVNVEFEDYFSNIGRPFKDILDILNINVDQTDIEKTFNDVSTQLIDQVEFYEGVESVLGQLANNNIKIGIVTSKNTIKTQKILDLLGFAFDIVQTPNDALKGKPAPDHILYAMSELNMNASDTLYIGDMDVDYEAAKRAHVNYVHALWGYGTCNDKNVIKLENITQLSDIILNE
ncbi:HAD family hydrolase [Candidatus Thioglobus autotrophicus]|uniref:HAD family hydrolase n=1 Tax=Candidatus Thioglobus autotrophicus TaxID=1705394 RepID=UPI00130E9BD5|nr:HAD family hydrolase [Candidatus Thioglobus autotrophicus]